MKPRKITTTRSLLYGFLTTLVIFVLLEGIARVIPHDLFETSLPDPRKAMIAHLKRTPKKDTYRIFVYGGSTSWGAQVPRMGYAAQLEFHLRRLHPDRPVEIYNFARPAETSNNVRNRLRETIQLEPDLLLVLSGHNEFILRIPPGGLTGPSAFARLTFRLVRDLRRRLLPRREDYIATYNTSTAWNRESPEFQSRVRRYRDRIEDVVRLAREHAVPLVLMVPPANISDIRPLYFAFESRARRDDYHRGRKMLAAGRPDETERIVRGYLSRNPHDALFLHLQGRLLRARGDIARARRSFLQAKEHDPLPWRALGRNNDFLRSLAERPGVHLIDVEAVFARESPNGLVGLGLIPDHVHPSANGYGIIAREIALAMHRRGWFLPPQIALSKTDLDHGLFLESLPRPALRSMEYEALLRNGILLMKTPALNTRLARINLERAARLNDGDWILHANLATIDFMEGRRADGLRRLARTRELAGDAFDPSDRWTTPYLIEALRMEAGELPMDYFDL